MPHRLYRSNDSVRSRICLRGVFCPKSTSDGLFLNAYKRRLNSRSGASDCVVSASKQHENHYDIRIRPDLSDPVCEQHPVERYYSAGRHYSRHIPAAARFVRRNLSVVHH